VIRLGVVGSNYGVNVLVPAFRADTRCTVIALAGHEAAKTIRLARETRIAKACVGWRELVDDEQIDAVAIAVPPAVQPEIAAAALNCGKPVFLEKPLAADTAGARLVRNAAERSGRPVMIDFEFPELPAWSRARELVAGGAIGRLRQASVIWHTENRAVRERLRSWKTGGPGGGVLGNLASHSFHYLEQFCGPIGTVSAQLAQLPGTSDVQMSVAAAGLFANGALFTLSVSCGAYLGSGHRFELYGDDGTVALANATADYMRGFELFYAHRPANSLSRIETPDPFDNPDSDGRIAPVSRLAARFLDAIEGKTQPHPGVAEALRVQCLIEAAMRSHQHGRVVSVSEVERDFK
jgi:predicted dehydrogenase